MMDSKVNKFKLTFEYLQYVMLKGFSINGEPVPEINHIEVDHDKRTLSLYFHGDISRAEGQSCPVVTIDHDEENATSI